ncbi:MAG TPA: hypothetical protein VLT45_13325 [Kofleriaceae bacterium]|nr:hypothetical protein [Kofleriaceae bacterium]
MVPLLLVTTSCVATSAGMMVTPLIALAYPPEPVAPGPGEVSKEAAARLEARKRAALATATHDAIAAATARPTDVRLQRRAAQMIRLAASNEASTTEGHAPRSLATEAPPLLAHLAEVAPCPGLADAGETWLALKEPARAADAYVAAAHRCESADAAIAAVRPLRQLDRCDDALAVLRFAWPLIHGARAEQAIRLLDAVASCSDALTLRRNLAFVPDDVVEDYFALLDARRREEEAERRRAEQAQRDEEARERAFEASSHCDSECSSAVSSCTSSCVGDSSCIQRCDAVGHACRSGC